jgi:hypothetical protein
MPGGGSRGVQLGPPSARRGLGRDLLVIAGAAAAIAVLIALLIWLFVPASARPAALGGTGPAAGGPLDVQVDRVMAQQTDGRQAFGSFTLRMRPDGTPQQLRANASLPPTPVPDERRSQRDVPPKPGSAEALLRDRVGQALGSLSYQQTTGEEGKERLRQAVKDAVNAGLPGAPVEQVFIREYLVQ